MRIQTHGTSETRRSITPTNADPSLAHHSQTLDHEEAKLVLTHQSQEDDSDTSPALAHQSQGCMEKDWGTSLALTHQSQEGVEEGPAHQSQHNTGQSPNALVWMQDVPNHWNDQQPVISRIFVEPTPRQSLGSPFRSTGSVFVYMSGIMGSSPMWSKDHRGQYRVYQIINFGKLQSS